MLVQAGLEGRSRRPRSPPPTRPPSTPTRRASTSCPPTSSRGRPSTSPRCSRSPRRSRTPGHAYATPEGNVYYAVATLPGLRPAVGQHARRPAGRPSRRGRAGQARPGRLRAVEGGRRGPAAQVADPALGRGLPGLAPRVLGDGDALPRARASTSTPAASTTSSPTTRTRSPSRRRSSARSPARHWVHGEYLLMDGRKMAKSAGNFQRVTELAERGLDPLAFRYLALTSRYGRKLELLGPVAGRRGGGARVAAGAAARRSARRRPTGRGPHRRRCVAGSRRRPARGRRRRPCRAWRRRTAFAAARPGARRRRRRCPPAGRALHDRFVAAIDDDLDLPTALALVREILRVRPAAPTSAAGSSSTPTSSSGSTCTGSGTSRPATRPRRTSVTALVAERDGGPRAAATSPRRRDPRRARRPRLGGRRRPRRLDARAAPDRRPPGGSAGPGRAGPGGPGSGRGSGRSCACSGGRARPRAGWRSRGARGARAAGRRG